MAVSELSAPLLRTGARLPDWARRAGPVMLAMALHALALTLLINLVRPAELTPPPWRAISVELVRPAPQAQADPAEAPPAEPPPVDAAGPQTIAPALIETPAQPAPEPAAEPAPEQIRRERAASSQPPAAGLAAGEAVLDAPGGADDPTGLPTRSSALRGLACSRAFGREDAVGCQDGTGLDFARFADGEGAARVEGRVAARFNALAGLYGAQLDPSLRRLPGQQGMQVMTTRRMGMSGADGMRETLPALVPDPAFGD
ncbi:MAG: hypothetical protein RKE49_00340 [Oceanicaulis sp.]